MRRLFSARSLCLFDALAERETFSYLSGLLIGNEIKEALEGFAGGHTGGSITIIGNDNLSQSYAAALKRFGLTAVPAPDTATARGQWNLAVAAELVR